MIQSRNEIEEQQCADEITAGENRNFPCRILWMPADEEAVKKFSLRLVKSQMHLAECAGKDEHQGQPQEDDGQPQRRKNLDEPLKEHWNTLPFSRN
jgi:hypothetical protein